MGASDADVLVIGAGVLGCMAARELARYKLDVLVIDKAGDVCSGASKANSGLVHAGFHPREHSLKGTSCVRGNAMYPQIFEELGVPFKQTGSLYVAFGPVGLERMQEKFERGQANGAPGLRIISGDEARAIEPRLSPAVVSALWAPTTGIVSPFRLVLSLYESASANGVAFKFGCEARAIEPLRDGAGWRVLTASGAQFRARYVLNMAGDAAEPLDAQVHPADLVVKPRRGQYYVFDKQDPASAITHPVMQSQETDEGGTLVTPTVDGNVLVGPTSENVRDYTRTETTVEGLAHAERVVRKLFPDVDMGQVIASFAGVRTNIKNVVKEQKDFVVRCSAPGFVSALGIKNPGMTCAPALIERAIELLAAEGLPLKPNEGFQARLEPYVPFMESSPERQRELLRVDAGYARMVCRCERITEGDVRRVARMSTCPHTLEALKHRLRTGMGRCQGSFCTPRVLDIVAEEWGMAPSKVPFGEAGGAFCVGKVK